ncbi:A/G-specific adenine glycosylase [Pseudalkalibacillus caeni]|uniref:Adenine DNA glycosylase n=1 Tax=Exobacillus caeni TaxID=2574798 RepID=A0A5R9F2H0_9BACL|nr:A/G-specific adenine glycosylase [Pseudalkalibacillus caeni]TLS35708.1 A/G-specific adenine glycosylase [Pseudalkalibacillus caeni]
MNKTHNLHKSLEKINKERFNKDLLSWYRSEQRDLPWRQNQDPYRIWVSEIMLQQTKVDTVIPYFKRFIESFPTVYDLAAAPEDKVLKAWEGLGYYSRARNLQSAVKEVVETYNGKVPDTPEQIANLKGVGPYTAGAILSIAYNKPEPAVDGNVMRVFSRILSIWDDIAKPSTRKIFEEAVRKLISEENPSHFNQALMELGAMVCTPKSPSCLLCPVQSHCQAFAEGVQDELPVKSKKKPPKPVPMAVGVLKTMENEVLIHKRPSTGLLANLWEFPNHETLSGGNAQDEQLQAFIEESYGVETEIEEHVKNFEHVFSHIKWKLAVYSGNVVKKASETEELRFVNIDQLEEFTFPVSHQKIIQLLKDGTI